MTHMANERPRYFSNKFYPKHRRSSCKLLTWRAQGRDGPMKRCRYWPAQSKAGTRGLRTSILTWQRSLDFRPASALIFSPNAFARLALQESSMHLTQLLEEIGRQTT